MLRVIAIGITPRIDDVERDRIQEFLDGTHPMSPVRKKYDTGTKRKTVLDQSPVGPPEIPESGDRTSHDNVGSGFKEGLDPNSQADDETGPGNTSKQDKEQTFMEYSTVDLITKNDFDTSSKWSPLNTESNKRDKNVTTHLRRLHQRPGVGALPRRYDVDDLVRASSWTYRYRV
ncbi:MAG: hypothetical protein ACXAC5_03175 [Promethearchaeota archaeon]|jgi:hypothetical protein